MNRRSVALGLVSAALALGGVGVTSASASAVTTTQTLPGGIFCAFDVIQTTKDNTKFIINPSGIRSTGRFISTFTNPENGKSVTLNASGAVLNNVSDHILTQTLTGPSVIGVGPQGKLNTGLPGIAFFTGRHVLTADLTTNTLLSFKPKTQVTDVCALLA
jgi:hypothetical protein